MAALIKLAESDDFVVSGFDLAFDLLELLFELQVCLKQSLVLLAHLMGSLVCTAQLLGPLLVARCVRVVGAVKALITAALVRSESIARLNGLRKLEGLFCTSEHVMDLAIRIKTAKNLVLRRKVELLHDLVELHAELEMLVLKFLVSKVLLTD